MRNPITILISIMFLLAGCATPRQMTLFTSEDQQPVALATPPQYIIEAGDMLQIMFSAINGEAIAPYNSAGVYYFVENDGTIEVPIIGRVVLAGKTTQEAIALLTEVVKDNVRNPIVRLSINNAAATILGEVEHPMYLTIMQPITLLEALGQVGGLTKNAKCDDVLVQRRERGQIVSYHINLLTDEIFHSPCYYLHKGDVIYVAPRHSKLVL